MYSADEPGPDVQKESAITPKDQLQKSDRFASLQSDDQLSKGSGTQEYDEVRVVGLKQNPSKAPESLDKDEDDDTDDDKVNSKKTLEDAMEEDDRDEQVNSNVVNIHDEDKAMVKNTPTLTLHNSTESQDSITGILMEPLDNPSLRSMSTNNYGTDY
ncbi:unnamed protein product [Cylindrotheca closterium]|uniref:Uncharacterized protein n=1 Tax=Cylindrotheca closterium TaxID=2856 RepID=A0AAD2CZ38_9STRA|nr:unnamed protein product [Cylindrotheca closterium]